jgi:hypothetical protein
MTVAISGNPTISGVVLAEQATTPSSPAAGKRKAFVGTDGLLKLVDSAGAVTAVGATGAVGYVELAEMAPPAAPAADRLRLFAADVAGVTTLYAERSDGVSVPLSAAGALAFTLGDGVNAVAASEPDQWLEVPFAAVIVSWRLLADAAGSVVVDLWRDSYANAPPTVADTITGGAKPTLSSAIKAEATTLTGWSPVLAPGDWLRVHVESASVVKRVVLSLGLRKT